MVDVSVVIPTYNRLDTLQHVLPSLLRQTLAPQSYELLVCDSSSNDGTQAYMESAQAEHASVRYLRGAYTGRAMARNAGIRQARGAVVLFNDSDIIADPALLEQHLRRHRERRRIAVVGWEVQVRSLGDYAAKRDDPQLRGALHPPARRKLELAVFFDGQCVGSSRRSACGRRLR